MSLKFAVFTTRDGKLLPLFSGDLPIRHHERRSRLGIWDLEELCEAMLKDENYFMPSFRLDLQRIALLAEPEVLRMIAQRVIKNK